MSYLKTDRIYQGDALKVLKNVEPGSAQLLLTDPPYVVSRPSNYETIGRVGCDVGAWDYDFDQIGWLDAALPGLAPNGSVVIWTDWKKLGTLGEALEVRGLAVKRQLTWLKKAPAPFNRDRTFVQSTETAIWAARRNWVFNRRTGSGVETGVFSHASPRAPKGQTRHPTQKPVGLFADLIEILTNPGDLVLDPFAGAATTAVAAEKLGRRFLCIEKKVDYVDLAPPTIERGVLEPETSDPASECAADAA